MGNLMAIVITILIGAVIGWLAGNLMKTKKKNFWMNVVIGIAGSFLGDFIFGLLGFSYGAIGGFIASVLGAMLLIFLLKRLKMI